MTKSAAASAGETSGHTDSSRSLSDRVYEEIYRRISCNEWQQGSRLPTEIELAEQFGVSRTVLREALLRLRIDGLITSRPGAGSFVTGKPSRTVFDFTRPGSIADIQRCYEFRVGVEGEAAFLAAERRSRQRIEEIERTLEAMDACIKRNDLGAQEDIGFHLAVARATENDYYAKTIEMATHAIMVGMKVASALSPLPPAERLMLAYTEHMGIFEAIRAGDKEAARTRMRAHIDSSRRRVFVGI